MQLKIFECLNWKIIIKFDAQKLFDEMPDSDLQHTWWLAVERENVRVS